MELNKWIPEEVWPRAEHFLSGLLECILGEIDRSGGVVRANPTLVEKLTAGESWAFAESLAAAAGDRWNEALARLSEGSQPQALEIAFGSHPQETYRCLVGRYAQGGYWLIGVRAGPTQADAGAGVFARRLADLERARAEAEREARTDLLTGLGNRRQAELWLIEAVQQAALKREPVACLMADLDHLKRLNDTSGHRAGDGALRFAASAFGRGVRATDRVARYGGDEFLIILPQTDLAGARVLATRLQRELAESAAAETQEKVTASFGAAALVPGTEHNPEMLRDRADAALLRAKRAGRNRVEIEAGP